MTSAKYIFIKKSKFKIIMFFKSNVHEIIPNGVWSQEIKSVHLRFFRHLKLIDISFYIAKYHHDHTPL